MPVHVYTHTGTHCIGVGVKYGAEVVVESEGTHQTCLHVERALLHHVEGLCEKLLLVLCPSHCCCWLRLRSVREWTWRISICDGSPISDLALGVTPHPSHPPHEILRGAGSFWTRRLTIVSSRSLCSRSVCTQRSKSVHGTQEAKGDQLSLAYDTHVFQ